MVEILSFAIGLSIVMAGWSLFALNREILVEGESLYGGIVRTEAGLLVRMLLPYARSVAAWILRFSPQPLDTPLGRLRRLIRRHLLYAGNPGGISAEEFLGLVAVGALLGGCFGAGFTLSLGYAEWMALSISISILFGAGLPVVWLRDRAGTRQRLIRKLLPYAIDLITLSIEAGLDFVVAIQRIVSKLGRTPLSEEFRQMLHEIQLGKSRREGLRDLKERTHSMDMDFFASALIQADEIGTGLGPVLRIQSEAIRTRRFQRAEEMAMKAPVKIIFPLIAFIMPTTLLIVFGPLAIVLLQRFWGGGGS